MRIKYIYIVLTIIILLPIIIFAGEPVKQRVTTLTNQLPATVESKAPIDIKTEAVIPLTPSYRSGEEINWQVISNGGTVGTSTNYIVNGTVSQTATNIGNSTNYIIHHGYWQDFGGAFICDCEPGEANGITPISILDVVYIINYRYKEGPSPIPYELCNGDADCNCGVDILDVVYIINYKYKEGPAPCDCTSWTTNCGTLRK